jgi:hypothetical protein
VGTFERSGGQMEAPRPWRRGQYTARGHTAYLGAHDNPLQSLHCNLWKTNDLDAPALLCVASQTKHKICVD